jgi:hypothetical protein
MKPLRWANCTAHAGVVNLHDARLTQGRDRLGLAAEAGQLPRSPQRSVDRHEHEVIGERGDLEVFVNISQMTVSHMNLTETTDSNQ